MALTLTRVLVCWKIWHLFGKKVFSAHNGGNPPMGSNFKFFCLDFLTKILDLKESEKLLYLFPCKEMENSWAVQIIQIWNEISSSAGVSGRGWTSARGLQGADAGFPLDQVGRGPTWSSTLWCRVPTYIIQYIVMQGSHLIWETQNLEETSSSSHFWQIWRRQGNFSTQNHQTVWTGVPLCFLTAGHRPKDFCSDLHSWLCSV